MVDQKLQHKVLARVRKMMKLAQNAGATEGERDNAMRMVHATLAKYNLSLSQVGAGESEEKRGMLGKQFLGKPWATSIAGAIARMYFCDYFYQSVGGNAGPSQKANHVFVGREANVVTANEMAQFVVEAVNREAQRYQRSIGGRYQDYRAFAQGAAERIRSRCWQITEDAKTKGVNEVVDVDEPQQPSDQLPGTALVLASLYDSEQEANALVLKQKGIKLGTGRSQSYAEGWDARRAGAEFGTKVPLHRQIKDK